MIPAICIDWGETLYMELNKGAGDPLFPFTLTPPSTYYVHTE